MTDYELLAQKYSGSVECAALDCPSAAKWMPVIEFRASADLEKFSGKCGTLPMALLPLGFCDIHRALFCIDDVEDGTELGIHAKATAALEKINLAPPDPQRTTIGWGDVTAVVKEKFNG
jgi:hypothetical protein